jgi:transcriptional regulator
MYIPKCFAETDVAAVKDFIAQNGFAVLVHDVDGRPWATHLPLMMTAGPDGTAILTGHLSRANPQWRAFSDQKEAMAIFSGPHAYISSSWYDHENVPTWNYQAVHVYGKVRVVEGEELIQQLGLLVAKYEAGMHCPVSVEHMSTSFLQKELKGIAGIRMEISEVQAVSKLSQNRDLPNLERIIGGLREQGATAAATMAALLQQQREARQGSGQ